MNGSRMLPALRPLDIRLAALALALLTLVAPAATVQAQDNLGPDLGTCSSLNVPVGYKVAARLYAVGVQIYQWNGTSWVFVAPKAVLFDADVEAKNDGPVGTHYAGPTWESFDGSKVVGRVLDRCTADSNAIPWLLLESVHNEGAGIFSRVAFIQRVSTEGGKAPATPGAYAGQKAKVPYTAEYYFYRPLFIEGL